MRGTISLVASLVALLNSALASASSTPANATKEPAQFFPQYNSQRVKIRYGPFTTDSMYVNNGMADFGLANAAMPCTDCIITWIQAGLEYENGSVANANTNFWLHHTVFVNLNRTSTVCPLPDYPDSFFASGNERTPIDICQSGHTEAGYYLASTDTIAMEAELMNMETISQTGYVTVTWEYIAQPPSTFSNVTVLWLDIGGCLGGSEQPVKSTTQPFDYTSQDWVSDITGRIVGIGSHLHDGGTHMDIKRNGTEVCDSVATYGATPGYIGGGMSMSMSMPMSSMDMSSTDMSSMSMSMPVTSTSSAAGASTSSMLMDNVHISNMSYCTDLNNTLIRPGDVWSITAHYDPTQHDLMMDMNGTAEPIMGISLIYVANQNVNTTAATSSATNASSTASTTSNGAGSVYSDVPWLVTAVSRFVMGLVNIFH